MPLKLNEFFSLDYTPLLFKQYLSGYLLY